MAAHNDLTPKQNKVLSFIQEKISKNFPPTIREIASEMGFSSTGTVRDYLKALKKKGFIKIHPKKSRCIELLKKTFRGAPILGNITAGGLNLAEENLEGYLSIDEIIKDEGIFVLKVKGDSMIEAGIFENDLAIVRKQAVANENDIVVALINNEATVKRFIRKNDKIYLKPENQNYKLIEITPDFSIAGKVIAIMRRF